MGDDVTGTSSNASELTATSLSLNFKRIKSLSCPEQALESFPLRPSIDRTENQCLRVTVQ